MYTGTEVARGERVRVAVIVLLVVACSKPAAPPPPESAPETGDAPAAGWTLVAKGIEYRMHDGTLHLVRVDPREREIDAVLQPDSSARAVAADGAFAINANFFDEQLRPLGVVVSKGRELNPPHPVSWQSVFYVGEDGKAAIVPVGRWKDASKSAVAAVQCGPRLIVNGEKNQVARAKPQWRSGVCIEGGGKVVFFATEPEAQLDVHEMVDHSAALGCRDAMLFDGGPSTQLYLRREGGDVEVEGDPRVPAYVVVK